MTPPRLRADSAAFLETGHLWLYEYPDGTPFTARLDSSTRLQVAFAERGPASGQSARWMTVDEAPPRFGFAVRALTTQLDRRAIERAVADPTALTLRCIAVHRRHRGYDWTQAPPIVGVDVAYPGSALLPHELEAAFDAFGIPTLPTLDTEVHVREIDDDGGAPPETQWGEGTAYGLLYRKKGGDVVRTVASEYAGEPPDIAPIQESAAAYAETVASDERLTSLRRDSDGVPGVSVLTDAVLDRTVRDAFGRLSHSETAFDIADLRSALAQRVAAFLDEPRM